MKPIALFLLFIALTTHGVVAQQYWTRPYLLIGNTVSGEHYKIKPGAKIFLKTLTDSVIRKVWLTGFASDSSVYIYGKKEVKLSDIDYLCIRPVVLKRTTRQVLFATGTIIFAWTLIGLNDLANQYRGVYLPWVLLTPPITILGTPIASSIVYGLTPWRSFQKGKNLSIKIVTP